MNPAHLHLALTHVRTANLGGRIHRAEIGLEAEVARP
jgi:hypothetical protein